MNTPNKNNGATGIGVAVVAGVIILFYILISLVACFGPGILTSYLFKKMDAKLKTYGIEDNTEQEVFVSSYSALCQVSIYIAGSITFYRLITIKGQFDFIGIADRLATFKPWQPAYLILLFVFIPSLLAYVIKIGDHFKDRNGGEFVVAVNAKNYYKKMLTLSAILFPVSFLFYGIRAKKISWMVCGVIYSIPVAIMYFIYNQVPHDSFQFFVTGLSIFSMWVASIAHTYVIREEYQDRIGSVDAVHVMNKRAA